MWYHEYKDYKRTDSMKKERIVTGKDFNGCEMHDTNGWQLEFTTPKKSQGILASLWSILTGSKVDE